MSNYNRDEMKKQGNASVGAALAILTTIAGGVIKHAVSASAKKELQDKCDKCDRVIADCDRVIADCDRQIIDLKSGIFGGFLNSEQINNLQCKRNEAIKIRNEAINTRNMLLNNK